ncbi:DNA methyltransferase [Streptomyces cinereus]|nr:DNA methyltransferase [Streptomyces cinereus]
MQSSSSLPTNLNIEEKKKLGAYYTPDEVCRILTNWAIQCRNDTVLEPSFGKCGFLSASLSRLKELGNNSPQNQIFGCDIDPNAFLFLNELLETGPGLAHFIEKDFMELEFDSTWGRIFSVSIGNPPFISSQKLEPLTKKKLQKKWSEIGIKLNQKASLWAHFLIHACQFIKEDGRLAWVLPMSFLQADYSQEIRKYISSIFTDSLCIVMEQKLFLSEGTDEQTVILLCKNKKNNPIFEPNKIVFSQARNNEELESIINAWEDGSLEKREITNFKPSYMNSDSEVKKAYDKLSSMGYVSELGDKLSIKLGIVTGDNKFFLANAKKLLNNNIDKGGIDYIISSLKYSKGIKYDILEHLDNIELGMSGYILSLNESKPDPNLIEYFSKYPKDKLNINYTFKKRKSWCTPNDRKIPDAFLVAMSRQGPRLVLNEARINCTNTIYRADFLNNEISELEKKLISISLLTSFSQLSAEFNGRKFGVNVLKLEPSEMKKIKLIIPETFDNEELENVFSNVDMAIRNDNFKLATQLADQYLLLNLPNGRKLSKLFCKELSEIHKQRLLK